MRFVTILLISVLFFCGCGESPRSPLATKPTDEATSQSDSAQGTPGSASNQDQADEAFSADLKRLTDLAKEQEAAGNYAEAARVWGQVNQMASNRFGAASWQSNNAAVAYQRAVQKSRFTSQQMERLWEADQLQEIVRRSLESGDVQGGLRANERAVEINAELFGEGSVAYAQLVVQSATIESNLRLVEQSVTHFHQGIETLKQNGYTNHPELELAHAGLASIYADKESFGPAIANQKEATRIAGLIWGQESLAFANRAHQLGTLFHRAGNLDVAYQVIDEAKLIRQRQLGTEHPAFANSCLNLGVISMDQKRFDQADEYFSKAQSVFTKTLGPEADDTLRCQSHRATIYMLQQRPELAEPLLRAVVQTMRASQAGTNSGNVEKRLDHEYRLAISLSRQGKYAIAKPLLEQVITEQRQRIGQSDRRTVASMRAYALLLERTNQTEAAGQMRQQIDRVAQEPGPQDFRR